MNRQLVLLPFLAVSMVSANPIDEQKKTKEEFSNKVEGFRDTYGDSASLRACEETVGLCGECDKFNEEQFERWRRYYRTCEGGRGFLDKWKGRLFYGGHDEENRKKGHPFGPNQLRNIHAFSIQQAAERVREADPEKRKKEMFSLEEDITRRHGELSELIDASSTVPSEHKEYVASCASGKSDSCIVLSDALHEIRVKRSLWDYSVKNESKKKEKADIVRVGHRTSDLGMRVERLNKLRKIEEESSKN